MVPVTDRLLEQGAWCVDRSCSSLGFTIRHFGVATVRGCFSSFTCRADVSEAGLDVHGDVDVASVETGDRIRDRRLRSEFFDADRDPAMSFRADCALPQRGGGWLLRGELTIRSVTRPLELAATAAPLENGTVRVRAVGLLRRSDFGLDWDALRQMGRLIVADQVRLKLDVVLRRDG